MSNATMQLKGLMLAAFVCAMAVSAQAADMFNNATASVAPISHQQLTSELTAGPNPASQGEVINVFYEGNRIMGGLLSVYDANGDFVTKISIRDKASRSDPSRRVIGSWDLTDKQSRPVAAGTYVAKGVVYTVGTTKGTAMEPKKVSVLLSVL